MIAGRLSSSGLPVVTIRLAGIELDAIIDTGFDGMLQLPEPLRLPLDPPVHSQVNYLLGVGQRVTALTYKVAVEFDGVEIEAETVFADPGEVLIGSELLTDYCLTIDYPAATVTLERTRP
jgi:predicted aspartyl protease